MKNIKDYNLEELKQEFIKLGEKAYRAEQVFKWLYVDKVSSFDEMTNLSKELREKLKQEFSMHNFEILKKQESTDGTKKYLFDILDGNAIETVLMEYHHGKSICVSTQVGCKMGCKFCASTGIKFVRNLTAGEIVEQILAVQKDVNDKISNVVFMGIGEPLDNFDNVVNAIAILNNQKGLSIGARHISISTSGLVPKIYELADKNLQCTLSISLHATNNEKRSEMMPVNKKYNIEELIECGISIYKYNKGFIHSKTIIADGKVSSIGTANLDIRSFQLNFEINAIIFDNEFTKKQEEIFNKDIKDSSLITIEEYNNRGRIIRIKEALIRLIAPIL